MSSLSNIYIKVETLETLLNTVKKKGEKGINIDISINEEVNDYGQNLSAYVSQTKEQRDAKVKRYYVGNGKCFWTDGKIEVAKKKEVHEATPMDGEEEHDDLPF
jgi:CRISPR/Cas system Type II protein with McrA/HNH and RuvC-like nuclease domain